MLLFDRAEAHASRIAVVEAERTFTYGALCRASAAVASCLLGERADLSEARVGYLVPAGFDYVAAQWGIWRAGGIAVPLAVNHPPPEIEHVVRDSQTSALIAHPALAERLSPISDALRVPLTLTTRALGAPARPLPAISPRRRALILYTSGTTARPKGVVSAHANIVAQVSSLVEAWEWNAADRILSVLPLHHIHGVVNVLACALWAGATCEMEPKFDAARVWERFAEGGLTLFMAVPTVYARLIRAWDEAPPDRRREYSAGAARLRLTVSGSAALPVATLEKWRTITGHTLLERYGMTEIGMALSNPLRGERVPGCVGTPLPGVEVRLVDETGAVAADGVPGEIQARGPGVFLEYWNNPAATAQAFCQEWFRTGDIAVREGGRYRILGRSSQDIIKTGGYKVSALEVENVLLGHGDVVECAVVGVPDAEWGERVSAALVMRQGVRLVPHALREWMTARLAPYKVPRSFRALDALPRNAMGKVDKRDVAAVFRPATRGGGPVGYGVPRKRRAKSGTP
jgi:malonyl-CoA/methylmalonyl-CoA synthetase